MIFLFSASLSCQETPTTRISLWLYINISEEQSHNQLQKHRLPTNERGFKFREDLTNFDRT